MNRRWALVAVGVVLAFLLGFGLRQGLDPAEDEQGATPVAPARLARADSGLALTLAKGEPSPYPPPPPAPPEESGDDAGYYPPPSSPSGEPVVKTPSPGRPTGITISP